MSEQRSIEDDRKFGLQNEIEIEDILKRYFEDNEIKKSEGQFCGYDFIGAGLTNMKYELKSRRCAFDKYDTTIIPTHKCKVGQNICFIFKFTDGLYYIYYDKDLFDEFKTKKVSVFRNGYWNPSALHLEIPTNLLVRIDI
jgi:hypothetical protein